MQGFATLRGSVVDYKGVMRTLVVVAGLAVPSIAAADVPTGSGPTEGFVQIERFDENTVAGGDFSYISLDEASDTTLVRFQLGGRFINPQSGIGAYATLPITYASNDDESVTALGNLELGGLMIRGIGTGGSKIALRAGITLPTADDEIGDVFVNLAGATARPQDIYLAIPEGTSLRLSASPMFRSGNVFGRLDLGFDINLDSAGEDEADPIVHFNAGVGVDLGGTAIMGELSNVYVLSDNDEADFSDKMLNVFAISARFTAGTTLPYVSLLIPLDDNTTSGVDFALTAGIEAKL